MSGPLDALCTFPERLAAARHIKQLTQAELAAQVGASRGHVGMLERGTSQMVTVPMVTQLAAVLGVSLDWLFLGTKGNDDGR